MIIIISINIIIYILCAQALKSFSTFRAVKFLDTYIAYIHTVCNHGRGVGEGWGCGG